MGIKRRNIRDKGAGAMPGLGKFKARLEEKGIEYKFSKTKIGGAHRMIEVNGLRVFFDLTGQYHSSETIKE